MELSIIIPTKDRGQIFNETLRLVYRAIQGLEAEIIVVNDSKHNTIELEPVYKEHISILNNPKRGVASARNLGAARARGQLLLFLDDDMLISKENLQATLQLHRERTNCCINLNWIYPPALTSEIEKDSFGRYLIHHGFTSLKGWNKGAAWDDTKLFRTDGITSQYLSLEKQFFVVSGGYTEGFPHAGFEDFDFARKLQKRGVEFYIYPLSMAFHNEADRLNLDAWLARKQRGGETRRVAVAKGHEELKLHYGVLKKAALESIDQMKPLLKLILKLAPDPLYFRIVNILLAAAIYRGYTKSI